jgi:hypothetical protein
MDDQSKFEGAGPEKIREHFNSWAVDELQRNWRTDREPTTKDGMTGAQPAVRIICTMLDLATISFFLLKTSASNPLR